MGQPTWGLFTLLIDHKPSKNYIEQLDPTNILDPNAPTLIFLIQHRDISICFIYVIYTTIFHTFIDLQKLHESLQFFNTKPDI